MKVSIMLLSRTNRITQRAEAEESKEVEKLVEQTAPTVDKHDGNVSSSSFTDIHFFPIIELRHV